MDKKKAYRIISVGFPFVSSYARAVYDIHLKDECKQKLNKAIKNASNDVLIEIIKDGRSIPIHHHYCTYSEIFLLEDLSIEELKNRGIDPVIFERKENVI